MLMLDLAGMSQKPTSIELRSNPLLRQMNVRLRSCRLKNFKFLTNPMRQFRSRVIKRIFIMATNSNIEWTHHTGNFWWGCTRVGEGCVNCYAATLANRWGKDVWDNDVREYKKQVYKDLPKWQKEAEEAGEYRRVFVGSMMDIFEKSKNTIDAKGNLKRVGINDLPEDQRPIWTTGDLRENFFTSIVPKYPNLMFLLLTKRPSNINKYIPESWKNNPPRNVMYGATVACQQDAKDVARAFEKVNGAKFLSIEPLIEAVDMEPFVSDYFGDDPIPTIDWVIVGGESGHGKRAFDPDWARTIQEWCGNHGVPFFMKQWDKVKAVPDDLMIRQFPKCHNLEVGAML